jgi:hypothetical protein
LSITLVPPNYYVIEPYGKPARLYRTKGQAAAALRPLAGSLATVSALTGSRPRTLTAAELRELGQLVRARRLHARNGTLDRTRSIIHCGENGERLNCRRAGLPGSGLSDDTRLRAQKMGGNTDV